MIEQDHDTGSLLSFVVDLINYIKFYMNGCCQRGIRADPQYILR